jgi:hypothetical protein
MTEINDRQQTLVFGKLKQALLQERNRGYEDGRKTGRKEGYEEGYAARKAEERDLIRLGYGAAMSDLDKLLDRVQQEAEVGEEPAAEEPPTEEAAAEEAADDPSAELVEQEFAPEPSLDESKLTYAQQQALNWLRDHPGARWSEVRDEKDKHGWSTNMLYELERLGVAHRENSQFYPGPAPSAAGDVAAS